MTDQAGTRPELSISELAAAAGRDRRTVDRWIKSGRFVGAHMVDTPTGPAWRVPVAEVVAAGIQLHAPTRPEQPAPKPADLDALAQLVAERDEWRRRAEVAEAVAEERGEHLADLRRALAPLTAGPIGDTPPPGTPAARIPEPPADDRRARWWRR